MHSDDFSKVKRNFSLKEYCKQHYPYKDHGNYIYIKCPFHNDNNPSLEVHDRYAKCRAGCSPDGKKEAYDAIDFLREAENLNITQVMSIIGNPVVPIKKITIEEENILSNPEKLKTLSFIYDLGQKKRDLAYDYLFRERKLLRPAELPTNVGFVEKDDLKGVQNLPGVLRGVRGKNAFIVPMYETSAQNVIGLYFRVLNDENIKHCNFGQVGYWLPEINGTIIRPNEDTWYAESVTDTFLTMAREKNYNVCSVFSCSNYPENGLLIVDSDTASIDSARRKNAIKIRIGDGKDHAESTRYIDLFIKLFDVNKMLTAILLYETDILRITELLPYVFVLANNNFISYCMAHTLRFADKHLYEYLIRTMYTMKQSALLESKSQFFPPSLKKEDLLLKPFELEKELQELFGLYNKYPQDVLEDIELYVASEKTHSIFNKRLIVENSINLKLTNIHNQINTRRIIDCGGLKYLTEGDVHVLAGHTGKGKTSVAMKMAENILNTYANYSICYLTFELTEAELLFKIKDDYHKQLTILECLDCSITKKMKHYIHFILNKLALQGYKIIIIDHMGFLTSSEDGQWLENVMQQIKTICAMRGITVVCLAQFVKSRVDDFKGYYATMDDIIGGSWINTIASSIWIIQDFEKILVNKKQEFKRYKHISQAKARSRQAHDPEPTPVPFYEFFNKNN